MPRRNSGYYPEGVVDVGVIVVSLFENPLKEKAVEFLSDVLIQRRRIAIPLSAILGAFHIATRYLGLPMVEVKRALVKMLETRSQAFYPYIDLEDAIDAVDYATYYRIESWDGYLVKLAKSIGNNIIYTLDKDFEKVEDIVVINPFPQDLIKQYHEHIKNMLRRKYGQ
ncbi:MAG: PIN domain-containing protein [Sulfolobales archaeon]